jgi:plastocyanin
MQGVSRLWSVGLALLAAVTAVHGTSCSAVTPETPKTIEVTTEGITFGSITGPVKVGDTIDWINKDPVDHTATDKAGAWDVVVPAGQRARVWLRDAGTFEYYCRFHPNMTARIVVTGR